LKSKVVGVFSPRLNKNHIVFYEVLSHLFHKKGTKVVFFIDKWFENKIKISAIKKPFNEFALSPVNKSEIKKLIIRKKPKN